MITHRPTLVLLHPFPMDESFWGPMWRALETPVTVLTPEFPGFGGTPAEPGVTIAEMADRVAGAIDAESGRAVVVGLSLGGYVALALAARHPETLAALVLANTRAEPDDDAARRSRDAAIDTVRIDGLGAYLDSLLPRLLSPQASTSAREAAAAIAGRQDPEAVCAALEALRDRPDRRDGLTAIAVPTWVIAGSDDAVTPLAALQTLAGAIPGAHLDVIAGAGHLSALERPEEFARIVDSALSAA